MDNFEKLLEMFAKYPKEIERTFNPMAGIIDAFEQVRRQWEDMNKAIERAGNQWHNAEQTLAMSVERTKQRFEDTFFGYKRSIENIERINLEWTKWTELTRSIEKI